MSWYKAWSIFPYPADTRGTKHLSPGLKGVMLLVCCRIADLPLLPHLPIYVLFMLLLLKLKGLLYTALQLY